MPEYQIQVPKVHITYDVEVGDSIELRELPFVVGVLGDFTGQPAQPLPKFKDRKMVGITSDSFDSFLEGSRPHLAFSVPNMLAEDPGEAKIDINLQFSRLEHFAPESVARQIAPLRDLLDIRLMLQDLRSTVEANRQFHMLLSDCVANAAKLTELRNDLRREHAESVPSTSSLQHCDTLQRDTSVAEKRMLALILEQGRFTRDSAARARGVAIVAAFLGMLESGMVVPSPDIAESMDAGLTRIDNLISAQLREVMHDPQFQSLEASWRGLHFLVDNTDISEMLKIRVLNVSKRELLRDLQKAPEYDQSTLYSKIYEEELGVSGGQPFGVLVGDYEFGKSPEDVELLEKISNVAAAANAPFLAAAAADLFNLESFTELGRPRSLAKILDSTEYVKWKSFRQTEDSRYIGLCLPRMMLRAPYGEDLHCRAVFEYQEILDPNDWNQYLWGNAAYALAGRLTAAFAKYGWCSAICGVEGGGLVDGLAVMRFTHEVAGAMVVGPTETEVNDRREQELSDLGFIPLTKWKNTDRAVFMQVVSCHKPRAYHSDIANANARLAAQLPYMFAVSRFAHYLKAMMRDKIGSFMSASEYSRFLNAWILQYVSSDDSALESVKAQLPLREGRVELVPVAGKPGIFRAVLFLKPHFQVEVPGTALREAIELPAPAK